MMFLEKSHASPGITFPTEEHTQIRTRLDQGKMVNTLRVSRELGAYRAGKKLKTEWGDTLQVVSVKRLSSAEEYPYFGELGPQQKRLLSGYSRIDWVVLKRVEKAKE